MKRLLVASMLALSGLIAAAPAAAATSTDVSMTFREPTHPSLTCPGFPDVSCGSGEVLPLGQATEIVVFGAGCGGTCDLRTVTLDGGSLTLEETATDIACPPSGCRPGPLELVNGNLRAVIVGGTGIFEGATGTLAGTVHFAISNVRPAGTAVVQYSGRISYDT